MFENEIYPPIHIMNPMNLQTISFYLNRKTALRVDD